ncbi:DNA-directed RNA polymerase subunit beta', partial [Chloroflexota bacterium]
ACPVSHIWFAKGIPSRLGLLLDLSPKNLEHVLYFSHYIVTSVDEKAREATIQELEHSRVRNLEENSATLGTNIEQAEQGGASVEDINKMRQDNIQVEEKASEDMVLEIDKLKALEVKLLLNEAQHHDYKQKYSHIFEAGMGAEAILQIIKHLDLDQIRNNIIDETQSTSGQRRKKAAKQLRVIESFRNSGNKPEWMILSVLPVLPPDLRPMVQLDGGRFATSDLNDLYRRVINRNNRLHHLIDIGAPEIIIRNEKRMLQESVDSLIDNGRRGRAISVSGNHKLKSLSDMLRGKQGRFRQNLLGKRVDYSGRSVIVVGPQLQLHQCGLPRRMALQLFKPFVMHRLVLRGLAPNVKSARRLVERAKPEVYDILEEVVKERPVLLNRAPTLHRLSIQAFEPVLVDGSALQLHPLVCSSFNADFDGDQMAVHLPLSRAAVKEARDTMLSVHNLLLPSSGEPTITPTLDMVLGVYYLTTIRDGAKGEGKVFGSFDDAKLAYDFETVNLRAEIKVIDHDQPDGYMMTSIGRIIFNEALPAEMGFYNRIIDKSVLKQMITECCFRFTDHETAHVLDDIKNLGFHYASKSGTTIAMNDIEVPAAKVQILKDAEAKIAVIEEQFQNGLITEDERYAGVISVWMETTDQITATINNNLYRYGGINTMATSGAKGNISQIRQMAGMRGLMTDPSGKIIETPIKTSLREGHSVLEYFISTHGARKGLADTALRTSESGYLTRRLIDVAQDVITFDYDCGTTEGIWVNESKGKGLLPPLAERVLGRLAASPVPHPETGEFLVERDEMIDAAKAAEFANAGILQVHVRSPLTCQAPRGICQSCYGKDLARGHLVKPETAVGIIAAQSIGEPGTQLTLRTFHTGGVVGLDITSGLPRVEELFEARIPKGQAIISEIDGQAENILNGEGRHIVVTSRETYEDDYKIPAKWEAAVDDGQWVDIGTVLATPPPTTAKGGKTESAPAAQPVVSHSAGKVKVRTTKIVVSYEENEVREYPITSSAGLWVKSGDVVTAGQQMTDGSVNPHDILRILGKDAVQQYLVDEVQKVYRSQGVSINDKHIEVIARQMLTKVRVDSVGDTDLMPDELVARMKYETINANVLAEGGAPATAHTVLLGITRASLSTDSWLASASFQETTRILTEAATSGKVDRLIGLKENVIIGKLIPARYLTPEDLEALKAASKAEKEKFFLEENDEVDAELIAELPGELIPAGEIPPDSAEAEDENGFSDFTSEEGTLADAGFETTSIDTEKAINADISDEEGPADDTVLTGAPDDTDNQSLE